MKIAFLHTPNFFTSELLKRFRTALAHHEVVEWIGGKDAPAFDFDVLLAMGYVGRALLQSQPKLKFIQTASDGYEEVDIEAASELGIWVSYAPADQCHFCCGIRGLAFARRGATSRRGSHFPSRRLCQAAHAQPRTQRENGMHRWPGDHRTTARRSFASFWCEDGCHR